MAGIALEKSQVSTTAPLVIVGMTGLEPAALLETLGLEPDKRNLIIYPTAAALTSAVDPTNRANRQILALSTSCEAYLAGSLAAGVAAAQAAQGWLKAAEDIIKLCRASRNNTLVLDIHTAQQAPSLARLAVLERFGRELAGHDGPLSAMPDSVSPIIHLLVHTLISSHTPLRRASAELTASIQPLSGVPRRTIPDIDAILHDIRNTQEKLKQAQAHVAQLSDETANLRKVLISEHAMMHETNQSAQNNLIKVQQDLDQAQQHHSFATAKQMENNQRLRSALEKCLSSAEKQNANTQRLRHDLAVARKEIVDLRSSSSWKITGPIRRISRLISPGKYRAK